MKNYLLYFLLFCFTMEQACTPSILKKVKVTRTITKPINLNYAINQVGNFQTYQLIDSRDITNLFDPENNQVSSATIEKIDIHDVYNNPSRVVKMIRHACSFEKARLENRRKYHEQMLRLAKAPVRRERRLRTEILKNK